MIAPEDRLPPLPAGPHPAPDEIYRARTDPSWPSGKTVLAHAVACAPCTEEMLRQEAFDEPEARDGAEVEAAWERFLAGEAAPVTGSPLAPPAPSTPMAPVAPIRRIAPPERRRPFRALLLLAATFAACFLGVSLWRLQTSGVPAPVTGPAPASNLPAPVLPPVSETTRGGPFGAVAVWSPSGEIAEAPSEFLFSQETPGPRRVTVYDAGRSYFWTSPPSSNGRIPFPDSERSKLTPGVDYFWTLLGSEGVPSEGAALRFRLEPPTPPR